MIDSDHLSRRVLERFRKIPSVRSVVDELKRATDSDLYVIGGSMRRALLGSEHSGDLDLMIPNGDTRAFAYLDGLRVPFEINRQRHRRYEWRGQQIDLFAPNEFFKGFQSVEAALRYFDLKIDALALHMRDLKILDPFRVLARPYYTDPGINWPRWDEMPPIELAVLGIRLLRIMCETPTLAISTADKSRARTWLLPQLEHVDWYDGAIQERFPAGKDVFFQRFDTEVLGRTSPEAAPFD